MLNAELVLAVVREVAAITVDSTESSLSSVLNGC